MIVETIPPVNQLRDVLTPWPSVTDETKASRSPDNAKQHNDGVHPHKQAKFLS